MKNSFVSVGKILNFHGVRGEAKLGYTKNREEFLSKLKDVYIQVNNEYKHFKVESLKFTPKCAIIKFKDIFMKITQLLLHHTTQDDITVQDIKKKINSENSIFKFVTGIFSRKG